MSLLSLIPDENYGNIDVNAVEIEDLMYGFKPLYNIE